MAKSSRSTDWSDEKLRRIVERFDNQTPEEAVAKFEKAWAAGKVWFVDPKAGTRTRVVPEESLEIEPKPLGKVAERKRPFNHR